MEKLYAKETISFQSTSINIIMFYKKKNLRRTINGNINVICYYSEDAVPLCLRYISQNDYNTLSPLYIPTKEHDIIMDEKNLREGI